MVAFVSGLRQSNPTFVSYRQQVDQILERAKAVTTKTEADAFLTRYGEYVVEQDQALVPRLQMVMTQLINPEGLMYIGKLLYFYQGDDQFIILDGDKKKVADIKAGKIDAATVKRLNTKSGQSKSGRLAAQCAKLEGFASTSNRRGYVTCQGRLAPLAYVGNDPNTGEALYDSYAWADTYGYSEKKVAWWWGRYRTINTLRVNYVAKIIIFGTVVNSQEPDILQSNDWDSIEDNRFIGYRLVTQTEVNNAQPVVEVEERAGYYTNQGLGTVKALYVCP